MKSTTPVIIITFIVSILIIAEFFLPGLNLSNASSELQNWGVIIAAFALGLAAVNLIRVHARRIMQKRGEWWNSVLLLFFLFFMIIVGLSQGTEGATYEYAFNYILTPLGSTMYAMLAFWIASAAYRAFIARSLEASILLLSAAIVMLGNAPIGEAIWNQFPVLKSWIMDFPNTAAMRGIMIGAAVGAIALGIRVMLGIERGYLGGSDE